MDLDLGRYALNITIGYGATALALITLASVSFAKARKIRRHLKDFK
ncbi:heme exporter protein CcmD [Paracoccaceae bacterium GXU_MW_L88]